MAPLLLRLKWAEDYALASPEVSVQYPLLKQLGQMIFHGTLWPQEFADFHTLDLTGSVVQPNAR